MPIHITLRSDLAKGNLSLLTARNGEFIRKRLPKDARKYAVRIFRFANVGNHLHLLVQAEHKTDLQNFLRTFMGVLARKVTKAEKGNPFGRFWKELVYTRLVTWGKAFKTTCKYVEKNQRQAGAKNRPYQVLSCLEEAPAGYG